MFFSFITTNYGSINWGGVSIYVTPLEDRILEGGRYIFDKLLRCDNNIWDRKTKKFPITVRVFA